MIAEREFGKINGKIVKAYKISASNISAEILNYGATIRSLCVKKDGIVTDVVLGYDTIEEYVAGTMYFGAVIGRVSNRIEYGRFSLNGKEYRLPINNDVNTLHGGILGFDKAIWDTEICGDKLVFSYTEKDRINGFPADIRVKVEYSITDCAINIRYYAEADGDTPFAPTNHAYFNLNGSGAGDILSHKLFINADYITPLKENFIPTGEFMPVLNTPFDFKKHKKIGDFINENERQIMIAGGYDHNFVLCGKAFRKVAELIGDKSGIKMTVKTDREGLQLYSGNFIADCKGKNGAKYFKRCAVCLETQSFPNAVNISYFPSVILKKGEKYFSETEYSFE